MQWVLMPSQSQGFEVRRVMPDGPSEKGGLKDGDIVGSIDGLPVGAEDLAQHLSRIGAGETVALGVIREGERIVVRVTLGSRG